MKIDRRTLATALVGLPFLGGAARAQSPLPGVIIETAAGSITVELYPDKAPLTAANFLRYVDEKRFDGAAFYRAVRVGQTPPIGLLQGGAHGDRARLLPPIAHEPTSQTGLRHRDGTLSMARREPGTADGEFFISLGVSPWFDVNPIQPGDNLGYAAFGQVVEGMDVVRILHGMPTSETEGEAYGMKGQILEPPIPMTVVRRA
ncbi:MAG: peptidylprolyl isomerase [Caulobacter sp.]|nr:peptidylprolyl isomerase [Caulobacter sp.]